jgi:hypothetical protein
LIVETGNPKQILEGVAIIVPMLVIVAGSTARFGADDAVDITDIRMRGCLPKQGPCQNSVNRPPL